MTLATFDGSNGEYPISVVLDGQGNLYGTIDDGGADGYGAVFEVARGSGTVTTLASFNGSNGDGPNGGVAVDGQGNLYGTTLYGYGTVFEVARGSGTVTTIATFDTDSPNGDVTLDGQGNLYGTTQFGGADGDGALFEVARGSGTVATLATFNGSNGTGPRSVAVDGQGNLYGTTFSGGANGDGTVFEVARGSGTVATLATFDGSNGYRPTGGVALDGQGNLYGTTFDGGANSDGTVSDGTVFEVARGSVTVTTLATFDNSNGANPVGGVALDGQGNLYGATEYGGANNDGTAFEVTSSGTNLILEVPTPNSSVPTDGTIPIEVEAVNSLGNPDTTVNGTGTIMDGGQVAAIVTFVNGTASATIAAPAQPGPYVLTAQEGALDSSGTTVNVVGETPRREEFNGVGKGGDTIAQALTALVKQININASNLPQKAQAILVQLVPALEKAGNVLSKFELGADLVATAKDYIHGNQAQFEYDFSKTVFDGSNLFVSAIVAGVAKKLGPLGEFLFNQKAGQAFDKFQPYYEANLAPDVEVFADKVYQGMQTVGVIINQVAGDLTSLITVNPVGGSTGVENLSLAGQNIDAQAGTAFNGVVATFLDATGNTNPAAYVAYISWGDGNFTQGTVSALPNGGFEVTGGDTYASTGIYSVSVSVVSIDSSTANSYAGATVSPAGPTGSTSAPVVSVLAPDITSDNADELSTDTFNVVYQDAAMVSAASLAGSTVQIQPPSGSPITAQLVGTQILGTTDTQGDGTTIITTYQFTPPGGNWYAAPPGTYSVVLGGSPVTDVSGNPVSLGTVGTFTVSVPPTIDVSSSVEDDTSVGVLATNSDSLTISGSTEAGSTVTIKNGNAVVSTVTAGSDGSWSIAYQAPGNGTYDFSATSTLGSTSTTTSATLFQVATTPPTSSVTPLPHTTAATSFTVSWSGSDYAGGPGIGYYNVYVSNNGGPYTLFQSETVATSATFSGLPGHTYSFYSVATDAVGNVQSTPTRAQATTLVTIPVEGDYDGDGKSDIAIYDQTAATFYILYSNGGSRVQALGNPADKNIPITGDFDGDGKTDLAIYDQTLAEFFVLESGGGTIARPFGNPHHVNIPIAGDYDGDGKTDIAIYDQTASEFLVLESGGGTIVLPFGNATHVNIPVAGDYDGDGKTDIAIYDQTFAVLIVSPSGGGLGRYSLIGNPGDKNVPIAADYDGDGKTDIAIYDQTLGILYAQESGGVLLARAFGSGADADIPIAGDFDGDGETDVAVYDPALDEFFVLESGGGTIVMPFGNGKHKNLPI